MAEKRKKHEDERIFRLQKKMKRAKEELDLLMASSSKSDQVPDKAQHQNANQEQDQGDNGSQGDGVETMSNGGVSPAYSGSSASEAGLSFPEYDDESESDVEILKGNTHCGQMYEFNPTYSLPNFVALANLEFKIERWR